MNNNRSNAGGSTPGDALSLLVNAADSREGGGSQSSAQQHSQNPFSSQSLADTLRLRGLGGGSNESGGGPSLEEQLFAQSQLYGAPTANPGNLLSQLRDHNILTQLSGNQASSHQQQLASLLGLGAAAGFGGAPIGGHGGVAADIRSALAAAQLRQQHQQPQLSHADILALSRSGALSGAAFSGLLGSLGAAGGFGAGSGLGGAGGLGNAASSLGGAGCGLGGAGCSNPNAGSVFGSGAPGGTAFGNRPSSAVGGVNGGGNAALQPSSSVLGGSVPSTGNSLGGAAASGLSLGGSGGIGGNAINNSSGRGGGASGLGGNNVGASGRSGLGGGASVVSAGGSAVGVFASGSGPNRGGTGNGGGVRPIGSGLSGSPPFPATAMGPTNANVGPPASVGAAGGDGQTGLASELESLQRLEEIERRQRLMASGASLIHGPASSPPHSSVAAAREDLSNSVRGPVIREERIPGGHIPRPPATQGMDNSQSSKKDNNMPPEEVGLSAAVAASIPGFSTAEPSNKEELEKTPGSVIVPCRARGMPMDHNFKTAYFVIPENVKHGEELICSYFACRNAGIKFRYCSHCKVPVAKRNFRKRHKHGGEDVPPIHGDGDDSDAEEVGGKRGIPSQITAKRSSMDADALSSNSAESNDKDDRQDDMVRSSMPDMGGKQENQSNMATPQMDDSNPKITQDRMQRWASLLGKRPATKEGDMMSAWLMEVLAVSDLDTPLKPADEMGPPNGALSNKPESSAATAAKSSAATAAAKEDSRKPAAKESGLAALIKKKRPAEHNDLSSNKSNNINGTMNNHNNKTETFASGSFAAWKERKKQKKASKINPTQEAEV